jgi:hypothetical protein
MKITPIVGQKGQKYGLIQAKGSNLFQDNDEEEDVNTVIRKEEFYKQKQIKVVSSFSFDFSSTNDVVTTKEC